MWLTFLRKTAVGPRRKKAVLPAGWWLIVPLGNPGDEYARTRHNLGRLMLQRWMGRHCDPAPHALHSLRFGTVYSLGEPFMALAPSTFMNLSGKAVLEAAGAGFPVDRMLVVHDDKDLPLGTGRLAVGGGAAGHGGVGSVLGELGERGAQGVLRLRLGIGPFERPLREWVLGEWGQPEWEVIGGMDAPFSEFMSRLARAGGAEDLMNHVNAAAFWKKACAGPCP